MTFVHAEVVLRSRLVVWLLAFSGIACASETPGKVVQVAWQLEQGASGDYRSFDTASGFHVELEEARVRIAAVYGFGPRPEGSLKATAWRWLNPVSVAHAHGGIDPETGRRVLVELLEPTTVDLLDGDPLTLQPIAAEAGALDAVKVELAESGEDAALHGGSVYLRGRVERDGESVQFTASVSLSAAVKLRSVDLLGVRGALDEGSILHVQIDPSVWLEKAVLDRLESTGPDDVVEVSADSQIGRALAIGVRSPEAFEVHLSAEGTKAR